MLPDATGHDIFYFDYFDGTNWVTAKTYDGGPQCQFENVLVPPPSGSTIRFRFRFFSDNWGSDEDGNWDTDGAAIIDNISVVIGSQTVNAEDFECEAQGAQQTVDGIWGAGTHAVCVDSTDCVTFFNPSCDSICSGAVITQVGFENLSPGQSVEYLGTVHPYLNISALPSGSFPNCNQSPEVIEQGSATPFWAYKAGFYYYNGCLTGMRGMATNPHDPEDCISDYQFTFQPGFNVNCFSIRMLDFSDYFPSYAGNIHTVSLTAYDGSNVQVNQDVLTFTGGVQTLAGDACDALPGDAGNYFFEVHGSGIKRIVLSFENGPDPRCGFDDISFCGWMEQLPCTAAPKGMRGWWSGDWITEDYSGYGNHGSGQGGVTYSASPMVNIGAFQLSGADYVRVPDNPSLDFGTATSTGFGDFSIDAWVFLPDLTGVQTIVCKFGPLLWGRGYSFFMNDGELALKLKTSQMAFPVVYLSNLTVPANAWTHVAVSVDRDPGGSTIKFYLNGQGPSTFYGQAQDAANVSNAGDLLIGAAYDPASNYLTGELDEVEVFARALPQSVFNDIYSAGYAGKCVTTGSFSDCNGNGIDDKVDIASGYSADHNGDDVPDECQDFGCGDHNKEAIDFGNVAIGDTATANLTIVNSCGAPFSGSVADTCGDFTVTAGTGPYTLQPGESLAVTVAFSPSRIGTTTCTIATGYYPGLTCTGSSDRSVAIGVENYWSSWRDGHAEIGFRLADDWQQVSVEVERRERATAFFKTLGGISLERRGGEYVCIDRTAERGREYVYHIVAHTPGGEEVGFSVTLSVPSAYMRLEQNQPNPFSTRTDVAFTVDGPGRVRLEVYDTSGRLVRTLVDRRLDAGSYVEQWDGRDTGGHAVASGIYFYQLRAESRVLTRKMLLVR